MTASVPSAGAGLRPWRAALLVFLVALPLLDAFYAKNPVLYDTDSSYHLAIARETMRHGIVHELPQVRFSALTQHGFTDSVLLFHLLLAPFAGGDGVERALAGGRLALALLDALLLATLAGLGARAAGWWGLLVPAWVTLGSLEVFWRVVRLRPELLSLLLLLLALAAAGSGRHRLLGLLAALYALSYVAWHVFLGLFLLLFLVRGLWRRRWEWPLALFATLGTALGLVVHPAFPANLLLWKIAAFDVPRLHGILDSGSELQRSPPSVVLLANAGFWLLALVLWRASRSDGAAPHGGPAATALADAFAVATLAFLPLYLYASRFALYPFAFGALWLLFALAARGRRIGRRVELPFGAALPTTAALALAVLAASPGTAQELGRFAARTTSGPGAERFAERTAVGSVLPRGARVAATWGDTATYLLWAPEGRYLNVLDPAAMALPFPHRYAAQRAVFAGRELDVPLVVHARLDSEYLAFSLPGKPPELLARLRADPRARALHLGAIHAVFALGPTPGRFALDWRVVPGGLLPPSPPLDLAHWPRYPRLAGAERDWEGYVDIRRLAPGRCIALASALPAGVYELAAAGATHAWCGTTPLVATAGDHAILGQGVAVRLAATSTVTVHTCPDADGSVGFYLLRR